MNVGEYNIIDLVEENTNKTPTSVFLLPSLKCKGKVTVIAITLVVIPIVSTRWQQFMCKVSVNLKYDSRLLVWSPQGTFGQIVKETF